MGTVYKPTVTKPMPAGAEVIGRQGKRYARWKHRGKSRTEALTKGKDGSDRLLIESPKYVAKYRDGDGVVRVVATGCRDEQAARQVLADLERRAEKVRAGVLTSGEQRMIPHQATPLGDHFRAYGDSLRAEGNGDTHCANTIRYLRRLAADCGFNRLADLNREPLERWLAAREAEGTSARTRNANRNALVAFCNWCVSHERLAVNPVARAPRANEKADRRRVRRSMVEEELCRLLDVARRRPLLDAVTIRRGPRKGQFLGKVRDATRQRLERLGRERALVYKTLVLTGLRRNELASLTVGQLYLDGPSPYAELEAADEKNREGSPIPIRSDLAEDIHSWLGEKLQLLRAEAADDGQPIPAKLLPHTPLFTVPVGLRRILDRDLKTAGIPKRDERGRTIDVHALRTTYGTLLSKGGVSLRTAQGAMRHSDPSLTANVYTDPKLLDVRGALDVLPSLPLNATTNYRQQATGTADEGTRQFAPGFAPTRYKQGQTLTSPGNLAGGRVPKVMTVDSPEVLHLSTKTARSHFLTAGR